jgi:hypothetical protein
VVSIKDSGLGIPAEDIPHLFQKFYRVSNKDRQEIGGTGLGLYLVRRLAENMQGRIWVESVFQKGSTFFLQLPRVDTQEVEHLRAEQQAGAQQVVQTPAPTPTFVPVPAVVAVPVPAPPQQTISMPTNNARPATSVPRGQSLTREQINERVKQLELLAQQQRGQSPRQ